MRLPGDDILGSGGRKSERGNGRRKIDVGVKSKEQKQTGYPEGGTKKVQGRIKKKGKKREKGLATIYEFCRKGGNAGGESSHNT